MKTTIKPGQPFLLVFILLSSLNLLPGQAGIPLEGIWEGPFMGNFTLQLHFKKEQTGDYTGQVQLFQEGNQLQHDPLSDIRLQADSLHFLIPAKETPFFGRVGQSRQSIDGYFLFPDGSKQLVYLEKRAEAEHYQAGGPLDKEKLRAGLAFLYKSIRENHPAPFAYRSREAMDEWYKELLASVDEVSHMGEFLFIAAGLTDAVGCSHTGVRPPPEWQEQAGEKFLPLKLAYLEGKLWCTGHFSEDSPLPLGAEILSINGRLSDSIIEALRPLIPAEGWNKTTKPALLNKSFENYYALLGPSPTFEITYRTSGDARERAVLLPAVDRLAVASRRNAVSEGSLTSIPFSITENYGLLQMPSFALPELEPYLSRMETIFGQLEQQKIRHLILDLRGNEGGHPIFAAILFSYLSQEGFTWFDEAGGIVPGMEPLYQPMEPAPSAFHGQLYLLVDGACLSTTGHLIAHLQARGIGKMLGEQPGSFASCNDNSRRVVLPYSQIEANIPRATFTIALPEEQRLLMPVLDQEVSAGIQDVLEGRDVVLEACLEFIRE